MHEREFWRQWWMNSTYPVSFSNRYNIVDTEKYDIINGEPVEREDYKKKLLEAELEGLNSYVEVYEKALLEKAKRKEEIEKELKKFS